MSSYLGIEPTLRPDFYFVSYNNEDAERLKPLMQKLVHYNVPLWYDYGLEYGKPWEEEITNRIQQCQAMLLFLTRGILQKENSYVTKEYVMATQRFNKTVYTIIIDDIPIEDVPNARLAWWIDVTTKQCLVLNKYDSDDNLFREIKRMLKISTPAQRIDTIMAQYGALARAGEDAKAERLLSAVLHEKELETKANMISNLYSNGYSGLVASPIGNKRTLPVVIDGTTFEASYRNVFRRIGFGDADVIDITRNGTTIYTIGCLVDADVGDLFYNPNDDLLYVLYYSSPNVPNQHEDRYTDHLSVCVIEHPCKEAVFHNYLHENLKKHLP